MKKLITTNTGCGRLNGNELQRDLMTSFMNVPLTTQISLESCVQVEFRSVLSLTVAALVIEKMTKMSDQHEI
jgi:molybdenum cofactor biosynthesis enzyme